MEFLEKITPSIISSIIIVAVAIIILLIIGKVVSRIKRSNNLMNSVSGNHMITNIGRVLKVIVILITIFLVFEINGINLTSLIASLGLVGAAATLAAQDIMKDAISGVYISGEKMFAPGDYVRYQNRDGMVVDFNLRSTKIRLVDDNSLMYISNRNITDIIILSQNNYMDLPMAYDLDIREGEKIIDSVISKIRKDEDVDSIEYLGIQSLDSSYVKYRLHYVCEPMVRYTVARKIRRTFMLTMSESGQRVPYEKLDVNIIK